MSIITKAGSPAKGSPTEFTLDKAELVSLISDVYFSDTDNWKSVALVYKSSTGNQSTMVKFDPSLDPCVANFAVSLKALDVFQIQKIVIKDFDGGSFEVPRSELTTAEFDVDMGSAPSGFQWDLLQGITLTDGSGELHNPSVPGIDSWQNTGGYSNEINGDFVFTAQLDYSDTGANIMIGYASDGPIESGQFLTICRRAIYFHNIITGFSSSTGNIGTISGVVDPGIFTIEISRSSGVITAKVNSTVGFTEAYAGPVYLGASIYEGVTSSRLASASV